MSHNTLNENTLEIHNHCRSLNVKAIKTEKYFFFKNYSYLVTNLRNHSAVLIDPAWEAKKIDKEITDNDIFITDILLTHSHFDHTDLANYFATQYNCNVWMSVYEIEYHGFKCKNLIAFNNLETLTLSDIKINPIVTPGHTHGSTCYLIDNYLFTGDTLFTEGCGLCWGKGSDPGKMFESLQLLKHLINPDVLVFPGHSYGKLPGKAFKYLTDNNIYLQFDDKEMFIDYRMRKNQKGLFNFV